MDLSELKKYIDECDQHGHRYFYFDINSDYGFSIRNNHVLSSSTNHKLLVEQLNFVLGSLGNNQHIDKIHEGSRCIKTEE